MFAMIPICPRRPFSMRITFFFSRLSLSCSYSHPLCVSYFPSILRWILDECFDCVIFRYGFASLIPISHSMDWKDRKECVEADTLTLQRSWCACDNIVPINSPEWCRSSPSFDIFTFTLSFEGCPGVAAYIRKTTIKRFSIHKTIFWGHTRSMMNVLMMNIYSIIGFSIRFPVRPTNAPRNKLNVKCYVISYVYICLWSHEFLYE